VPAELVEHIARHAAELVLARIEVAGACSSPFLSVAEAADYLRAGRQRVYDLLSARRLTRYKDGSRVLVSRAELDDYLAGGGSSRVAPALPRASGTHWPSRTADSRRS
jgi:excisionase family DNA binding protein